MKQNKQHPSEHNEYRKPLDRDDAEARIHSEQQQLVARGFLWEEAIGLAQMHVHFYENVEVKQRLVDDEYMQFARWLYLQGEMNENGQA